MGRISNQPKSISRIRTILDRGENLAYLPVVPMIPMPAKMMPGYHIFDRHANLKYKYGSRHFWCRDYYVDTVGES